MRVTATVGRNCLTRAMRHSFLRQFWSFNFVLLVKLLWNNWTINGCRLDCSDLKLSHHSRHNKIQNIVATGKQGSEAVTGLIVDVPIGCDSPRLKGGGKCDAEELHMPSVEITQISISRCVNHICHFRQIANRTLHYSTRSLQANAV